MRNINTTRGFIITLALTAMLTTPVQAGGPGVPTAIDRFIAKLFPNAAHYFWVVNNSQTEAINSEIILDLNAFVTEKNDGPSIENRYLLLIMNGKILAAQHIPLDSNVDCGKDEEV